MWNSQITMRLQYVFLRYCKNPKISLLSINGLEKVLGIYVYVESHIEL